MWNLWLRLKKFGLGHSDVPTVCWNLTILLRFLTINIDSNYQRNIPVVLYISTALFALAYFYVYVVSIIWYYYWRCLSSGDKISGIITLSLGICSAIGITKLIYFQFHKKELIQIVDGCLQCDAVVVPLKRMYDKQLNNMRFVKKRAMTIWMILMVNWLIYVIKPIIIPGRHLIEEATVLYGLEPMLESPNYEIAYVTNAVGSFFVCYAAATMSALFIIMSGISEAQMLALSDELLSLWDDVQTEYEHNEQNYYPTSEDSGRSIVKNNKLIDALIKQGLERIVKTHAMNVFQVKQVENLFNGAIAIEFLLLLCALIAELLGGLENTYQLVPFAFIQVAMDCLAGQRIMDASRKFENAVYNCKWENFNVANMKTVFMILKGSQKTMIFTAGGMATLTFACLMTVVRSIYSAYTTLRTTMSE